VENLFRDREAAVANGAMLLWVASGWVGSFALMGAASPLLNAIGVLLCAHAMVLAAYLIHEAAHQTLFAQRAANTAVGEFMNFIAGSSYASFERIRHMHIRHHMDRADLTCFDFKGLLERRAALRRVLEVMEWCYLPATETLLHLQVVWRPFFVPGQRRHRRRAAAMLVLRLVLLVVLGLWSGRALLLYFLALALQLQVLNFFDAFHHSFEQYFVEAEQPVPMQGRDRAYEQANTYSNLISSRHPWLNVLILNFGYHNAHHQRASVPWYRLPAWHRSLYGEASGAVMPLAALFRTWHRNRVHGAVHGVSFLTVV
jgi:fatty acid desaturase